MSEKSNAQTAVKLESLAVRWVQKLFFGCGVGGGATLMFLLAEKQPGRLIEMLEKFGPETFLGVIALVILDRNMKSGISIQRDSVAAMQKASDAITQIANKDDEHVREMELLLDHLARGMRELKSDIHSWRSEMVTEGKAHGHSAGH